MQTEALASMNTIPAVILTLCLSTIQTSVAIAATAVTSAAAGSTQSSQSNSSESTITGSNGVIIVNGDTVKVENGRLTVNGVSYGTVENQSVVRYSVKGDTKKLFVDDVERHPSP
jgi:hypothetical protein